MYQYFFSNHYLDEQLLTVLNTSLVLQLTGMVYALIADSYINKRQKNVLLINAVCIFTLVIQQNLGSYYEEQDMIAGRTAMGVYGYCIRVVILCLFIQLFSRSRLPWVLVGINTAVYLSAFFSDIAFSFRPDGNIERGPLAYTCVIISAVLLLQLTFLSLRYYWRAKHSVNILPLVIEGVIIAAVIVDMTMNFNPIMDYLTITIVNGSLFYYIWLHLLFVREHEEDLKAQQRIKTMVSQIQPHFIYNSLTAIRATLDEPKKARELINHFSRFLRGSIDVLEETECIRVERELETVSHYLFMEKERFGDDLTVVKDIRDEGFVIPAFAIQTLAENAVNHGVRESKDGVGTVTIRTFRKGSEHIIEVCDDGAGFTENTKSREQDEHKHIGLSNLRERLYLMCGGILEIESEPGKGTLARIRIPITEEKRI